MKEITEKELQNISRRAFLLNSAKAAAGIMVAGVTAGLIDPQIAWAEVKPKAKFEYTFKETPEDTILHPMKYPGLDPLEAQERSYTSYFEKGG